MLCCFFDRADIDWNKFAVAVKKTFPRGVEIIEGGCSDGSESYSKILAIIHTAGKSFARKILPVKVFDIDKEIIKQINSKTIGLTKFDMKFLKKEFSQALPEKLFINSGLEEDVENSLHFKADIMMHNVNSILKGAIKATCNDIMEESEKERKKPVIFTVRNVIQQLKSYQRVDLINNLSKNLKTGSWLLIGDKERDKFYGKDFMNVLEDNFKPIKDISSLKQPSVFEKI